MENRDIGLIIGGSIALAITAIGLAIYGIRRMNNILNDKVRSIIKCTADYEEVDVEEIENRVEENKEGIAVVVDENDGENKSEERFNVEHLSNDEFIKWHDDNIDRLNKMLDGIEADQVKLKKSDGERGRRLEERDKDIKELQKGQEETNRKLDELKKDSDRTTIAAQELVAFGKAINAELAPQAAALAQDKKMIEGKLDQLQQSENKVIISDLMLDGLEQVDELLKKRGVFDYNFDDSDEDELILPSFTPFKYEPFKRDGEGLGK